MLSVSWNVAKIISKTFPTLSPSKNTCCQVNTLLVGWEVGRWTGFLVPKTEDHQTKWTSTHSVSHSTNIYWVGFALISPIVLSGLRKVIHVELKKMSFETAGCSFKKSLPIMLSLSLILTNIYSPLSNPSFIQQIFIKYLICARIHRTVFLTKVMEAEPKWNSLFPSLLYRHYTIIPNNLGLNILSSNFG